MHEAPGLVGITLEPQRGSTTKPRVSEAAEPSSATLGYRLVDVLVLLVILPSLSYPYVYVPSAVKRL